jgi:adenine-specific DNA-methyltransferase
MRTGGAARIARQKEVDTSIAAKAEFEYLYDKPYPDPFRIRVTRPFTVESLSPHRVLAVDADDSLIDTLDLAENGAEWGEGTPDFAQMALENLKMAGVQQAHKEDRIAFTSLVPWPGDLICAEGRYMEGCQERRAAIFLGPDSAPSRALISLPPLVRLRMPDLMS